MREAIAVYSHDDLRSCVSVGLIHATYLCVRKQLDLLRHQDFVQLYRHGIRCAAVQQPGKQTEESQVVLLLESTTRLSIHVENFGNR